MSVLIKGMKMPKNCDECMFHWAEDVSFELMHRCQINGCYINSSDIFSFPYDCPLIELPVDHGALIDASVLYEKTAEWEAQALHMCEVCMNDEDTSEWKKWSTILTERSAFKHDIADSTVIVEAEVE